MTGIAYTILLLATTAQLGVSGVPVGSKYGWKIENDGSMSYIAQVTPEVASVMAQQGQEIAVPIPDFLQGRVRQVVWRIGISEVEREPSEAELLSDPRSILPRGVSPLGAGTLSTLSDRTGSTVPIDPVRVTPNTMPTSGTSRLQGSDASLEPPQLAQNYAASPARSNFNNTYDPTRLSSTTGGYSSTPTMNNSSVLPRNDGYSYAYSTGSQPVGPTLPPGYTGSNITVTGTPTTSWNNGNNTSTTYGGMNAWNSNNSTGSLSGGNFGNTNGYGTNASVPSLNYSTPSGYGNATSTYGSTSTTQPNAYLAQNNFGTATPNSAYPNQSPYNGVAANGFNNNGITANGYNVNNGTGVGLGNNGMGSTPYGTNPMPNYNYSATTPYGPNPSMVGTYGTGYGAMPALAPSLLASNLSPTPVTRPSMIDETKRTIGREYDDYPRDYATPTAGSASLLVILLLVSVVGNVYLIALLNQLLQRYRALQAGSRSTTSLAV
jgi:hypothetical protein